MALMKNWGYSNDLIKPRESRRSVRYVGRMSKASFIRTVKRYSNCGTQWIRDRMSDTGNGYELQLIGQYPNKVVLYDERTHEILEIMDGF